MRLGVPLTSTPHGCLALPKGTTVSNVELRADVTFSRNVTWMGGRLSINAIRSMSGSFHLESRSLAVHFALEAGGRGIATGREWLVDGKIAGPAILIGPERRAEVEIRHLVNTDLVTIELTQTSIARVSGMGREEFAMIKPELDYHDPLAWEIARDLRREYLQHPRQGRAYLEIASALFAVRVARTHSQLPRNGKRGGLAPHIFQQACDFMQARIAHPGSLARAADHVGLSPGHFATAFKETSGLSPGAWLRRRRIEQAKQLLLQQREDLSSIAAAVGYANQSAFGAAFKAATGLSPLQWRRFYLTDGAPARDTGMRP
jgi:AraC family transcriptional regulator